MKVRTLKVTVEAHKALKIKAAKEDADMRDVASRIIMKQVEADKRKAVKGA